MGCQEEKIGGEGKEVGIERKKQENRAVGHVCMYVSRNDAYGLRWMRSCMHDGRGRLVRTNSQTPLACMCRFVMKEIS